MAKFKISADEALDLATQFRDASTRVGDYLYENWPAIPPKQRETLRSLEVTLLNLATDLVTQAVGIVLDDTQASLAQLTAATKLAKKALAKIQQVKDAINVVTALIGLAAAIPTGSLGSIVSAAKAVQDAANAKSVPKLASAESEKDAASA